MQFFVRNISFLSYLYNDQLQFVERPVNPLMDPVEVVEACSICRMYFLALVPVERFRKYIFLYYSFLRILYTYISKYLGFFAVIFM